MGECRHKPPCPLGTPPWQCGKRSEIEAAVFHGTLDRPTGTELLRKFGLPIRPASATERYQTEQRRIEKGLLF